jgi:ACS family glucarate transporter-like MFS transporter
MLMAQAPGRVRWLLVFWLFVLSAVAFLDRVNMSIAGSSIAAAYHLSNEQLGWVFSAFLVGYAAFQTLGGWLADRFGSRRVLTGGAVWWGIFTALTAAVPLGVSGALILLIVIRFLFGAGEAVVYPACNQFVARWIPTQERGRANGWIFAGVGIGSGLTPPFITYLMIHYGWRWSFWVCAMVGLLAGLVWFVIARDQPEDHSRVSESELKLIRAGLTLEAEGHDPKARARVFSWGRVLKNKDILAVTLSYFCFGYTAWIFFGWFYIYLAQVRGLNLKASAFYAMLPFLAMAACCPLGGTISDRFTRRRGPRLGRCWLAAIVMATAAIFLSVGSQVESARVASIVLAGGAGALYLAQSSFWSVTADVAGASSGSVSGFMNMGAQIGGAVTASLTPWIASRFGWTASFLVAAGLCLLGAAAWLLVDPTRSLAASAAPQRMSTQPVESLVGARPGTAKPPAP